MMTLGDVNRGDYALTERLAANRQLGSFDYRTVLLEQLELSPGLAVLDVACGDGAFTLDFKRAVGPGRVAGFDFSAELVQAARRAAANLEIEFAEANALALPVDSQSFDRICCSYAIYHFPSVEGALDEMFRVARRGAKIVLTGPTEHNNRELYVLHELGGGEVRAAMGRDVFQSRVGDYLRRKGGETQFTEHANIVRFSSREDMIHNYSLTKLFHDNVQPADREGFLVRLRQAPWPQELEELIVTKTVGVFTAWN